MHQDEKSNALPYELTLRRYLFGKDRLQGGFDHLTPTEYIALHMIKKNAAEFATEDDKIYLQDLADQMELSIHQASKLARGLKERGLIVWSHDGDGEEGTYICETDMGAASMKLQDAILEERYKCVIDAFGYDKLVHLLSEMKRLNEIIDNSFSRRAEGSDEATE